MFSGVTALRLVDVSSMTTAPLDAEVDLVAVIGDKTPLISAAIVRNRTRASSLCSTTSRPASVFRRFTSIDT